MSAQSVVSHETTFAQVGYVRRILERFKERIGPRRKPRRKWQAN